MEEDHDDAGITSSRRFCNLQLCPFAVVDTCYQQQSWHVVAVFLPEDEGMLLLMRTLRLDADKAASSRFPAVAGDTSRVTWTRGSASPRRTSRPKKKSHPRRRAMRSLLVAQPPLRRLSHLRCGL